MVTVSAFSPISPEAYLAAEATSSTKHEYRDGHLLTISTCLPCQRPLNLATSP